MAIASTSGSSSTSSTFWRFVRALVSDDVKRAIIQTAENTAQLAERARTGGFVFS